MTTKSFSAKRDAQVADEFHRDQAQMCQAHGCPNRWSRSDTMTCRWHSAADPHDWPRVTQEALDYLADLARSAKTKAPVQPLTPDEKREIALSLRSLKVTGQPLDGRAWARKVRARERAGDRTLTQFQRDAWRTALAPEIAQEQTA